MKNKEESFRFISNNEIETLKIAADFVEKIDAPTNIILMGDLGAGKTHFVRGMVGRLDNKILVNSPTFTILNQYIVFKNKKEIIINHFDLYRLNEFEELYFIGIEDFFKEKNFINIFEWGDKFEDELKEYGNFIKIEIKRITEFTREIVISKDDLI